MWLLCGRLIDYSIFWIAFKKKNIYQICAVSYKYNYLKKILLLLKSELTLTMQVNKKNGNKSKNFVFKNFIIYRNSMKYVVISGLHKNL